MSNPAPAARRSASFAIASEMSLALIEPAPISASGKLRLPTPHPALETAHAFAWLDTLCPTLADGAEIVINCSGRGEKDVNTVAEKLGDQL